MNNEEQNFEINMELQDKEKQLDKLNTEIREKTEKQEQLQHRLTRERQRAAHLKRMMSPEYRVRTHELIEKGGTVEHFYPSSTDLTDHEFYEVMEILNKDKEMRARFEAAIRTVLVGRRRDDNGIISVQSGTTEEK